jgi:histone H3/H4
MAVVAPAAGTLKLADLLSKFKSGGAGESGMTKGAKQNVATGLMGAGQMVAGMIQRKKADALIPTVEDKMSRDQLEEIRRKRRSLETTLPTATIRQMVKGTGINAFKTGGMANTGALAAMISQGLSGVAEQQGAQSNSLLAEQGKLVSEMAQRKSDIGMYRSQVKKAQAENNVGAGQTNLLAAIGGGKKKKVPPVVPPVEENVV